MKLEPSSVLGGAPNEETGPDPVAIESASLALFASTSEAFEFASAPSASGAAPASAKKERLEMKF